MGPGQHDNFEIKDDNLNAENWQRSLEISTPVDLPTPEKLAAVTEAIYSTPEPAEINPASAETTPTAYEAPIISSEASTAAPEQFQPQPQAQMGPQIPTELGQITSISAPINTPSQNQSYNPVNIKTTGDKLEKSSITEVDNAISQLNQTGNLSDFYDQIRGMTEVNLNNSFNRKLGDNSLSGGAGTGGAS